jgi:uncharacterized membrane protein
MLLPALFTAVNVFSAGLLAGEEFIIRFGVRGPLAALDPAPHIRLRQSLIRTLRVLVPALLAVTLLSAIATAVVTGLAPGWTFRAAGLAALVLFIMVTLAGTVPINQAVLVWNPQAPPPDWQAAIRRWERLDDVRTAAAVAAFVCFLLPMVRA